MVGEADASVEMDAVVSAYQEPRLTEIPRMIESLLLDIKTTVKVVRALAPLAEKCSMKNYESL